MLFRSDVDAVIKSDAYDLYSEELKLYSLKEEAGVALDLIYDYSVCYSLNPNFISDYKSYIYENKYSYAMAANVALMSGKNFYSQAKCTGYFQDDLKEDEVLISYAFYNELFGTYLNENNDSSFTPVPIKIQLFDLDNNCFFDKEFTVTGLYKQRHLTDTFRLSDKYYMEIADVNLVPWAMEIFTQGNLYDLWDELMDNNCSEMHREPRLIFRTIQLLSVFYEVFAYISMVVILAIFLIIILNASTIIRQNVYEIGVMKALGAKTSELVVIFTLQMVITCLGVCLLLYSCSNIFMNFANKLLCSGISAYVVTDVLYNVIVFSPKFFIINIVSVSVFTIFSIMVPILAIRKIKPLKIIKTRN